LTPGREEKKLRIKRRPLYEASVGPLYEAEMFIALGMFTALEMSNGNVHRMFTGPSPTLREDGRALTHPKSLKISYPVHDAIVWY